MHCKCFSFTWRSQELQCLVHQDITRIGKESGLHSFEQVNPPPPPPSWHASLPQAKAIELEGDPFSVDNNCLTPTFKLRRPFLKSKYMPVFVQLYRELPS